MIRIDPMMNPILLVPCNQWEVIIIWTNNGVLWDVDWDIPV